MRMVYKLRAENIKVFQKRSLHMLKTRMSRIISTRIKTPMQQLDQVSALRISMKPVIKILSRGGPNPLTFVLPYHLSDAFKSGL